MIEFSFDDEMRILLLFLMEKEADSLRDILNGNNLSHAAETLYAAHHSNAYGHTATNRVMNNALERHYG